MLQMVPAAPPGEPPEAPPGEPPEAPPGEPPEAWKRYIAYLQRCVQQHGQQAAVLALEQGRPENTSEDACTDGEEEHSDGEEEHSDDQLDDEESNAVLVAPVSRELRNLQSGVAFTSEAVANRAADGFPDSEAVRQELVPVSRCSRGRDDEVTQLRQRVIDRVNLHTWLWVQWSVGDGAFQAYRGQCTDIDMILGRPIWLVRYPDGYEQWLDPWGDVLWCIAPAPAMLTVADQQGEGLMTWLPNSGGEGLAIDNGQAFESCPGGEEPSEPMDNPEEDDSSSSDSEDEEFEVKEVLGRRDTEGTIEYLVRWAGVDPNGNPWEDSWEPAANLANAGDLVDAYNAAAEGEQAGDTDSILVLAKVRASDIVREDGQLDARPRDTSSTLPVTYKVCNAECPGCDNCAGLETDPEVYENGAQQCFWCSTLSTQVRRCTMPDNAGYYTQICPVCAEDVDWQFSRETYAKEAKAENSKALVPAKLLDQPATEYAPREATDQYVAGHTVADFIVGSDDDGDEAYQAGDKIAAQSDMIAVQENEEEESEGEHIGCPAEGDLDMTPGALVVVDSPPQLVQLWEQDVDQLTLWRATHDECVRQELHTCQHCAEYEGTLEQVYEHEQSCSKNRAKRKKRDVQPPAQLPQPHQPPAQLPQPHQPPAQLPQPHQPPAPRDDASNL